MADLSIKDNWFSILKKKNLTDDQKNIVEWFIEELKEEVVEEDLQVI